MIDIQEVSKVYPIYEKNNKQGFLNRYISNKTGEKLALDQVSFHVCQGEFIGLLGPNGAGKSTLIKILSGVLAPSTGSIEICGLDPIKNRKKNAKNIGVLFGQKTQLWWDLPLIDSLKLLGEIYGIPAKQLAGNIEEFIDLIGLHSFINRPVRQLSLGERMKGEIAACLIHEPPILFLDEPTIGLDVLSKYNIHNLLKNINSQKKITVILTTHNVDDIEKLCERVVFINKGQVIFDNTIHALKQTFENQKYAVIEVESELPSDFTIRCVKRERNQYWFQLHTDNDIYPILFELRENSIKIKSFTLQESQLEEVIRNLYLRVSR